MASPNEASVQAQFNKHIRSFDQVDRFLNILTPSYQTLYDDVVTIQDMDFSAEALGQLEEQRAALNGSFDPIAASSFSPYLRAYAKLLDFPESDDASILRRLFDDFVDRVQSVKSREFTFGAPSAITGTGDGVINRLNTDRNAQDIENQTPDAKDAICVADVHSGADEHEEQFQFTSGAISRDFIPGITGSGLALTIAAVSARNSLLLNPSFEQFEPAGTTPVTPTALTAWTALASLANFTMLTSDAFRGSPGIDTPVSIRFDANDTLTQLLSVGNTNLNPLTPYYVQVAVKRKSAATGNFTLTLGSKSLVTTIASLTTDVWTVIRLPLDQDSWFQNFNKTDPAVELKVDTLAVGTLLVDDVIFVPYTQFDGSWYTIVGGETSFLVDDKSNWADTALDVAIVQRWLWRSNNSYLPHNAAAAETWPEPT